MTPPASIAGRPPLVVDLDGTLILTDSLWEMLVRLIARRPLLVFAVIGWLFRGRAGFKTMVARHQSLDPKTLPLNRPLLAYLEEQHRSGRSIILATSAHKLLAEPFAAQFDVFNRVLSTEEHANLTGPDKAEAVQRAIGSSFSYAGNSRDDFPVWAKAQSAVVVTGSRRLLARVGEITAIEKHFDPGNRFWAGWTRSLRLHQWLKNLLVFIPLVTTVRFEDVAADMRALMCFVAFCVLASGSYIVNDLVDLDNDRAHRTKVRRPLASGAVSIPAACATAILMIAAGLAIGAAINIWVFGTLAAYLALTLSYSLLLKRYAIADLAALASLYTLRIIAGAYAIAVPASHWLLSFSCLMFFGLAVLKRCTELEQLHSAGGEALRGRGYRAQDLRALWPIGIASGFASIVVFQLFVATELLTGGERPSLVWIPSLLLIYWLVRVWLKTSRGEMHDDPVVFAVRDRTSRLLVCAMLISIVVLKLKLFA
jgi:4-hydroxybenzoate polyprenyltransferase/phosphoserine phosphatase